MRNGQTQEALCIEVLFLNSSEIKIFARSNLRRITDKVQARNTQRWNNLCFSKRKCENHVRKLK